MVANWRQARSKAAIGFILVAILFYGCAAEGRSVWGADPFKQS